MRTGMRTAAGHKSERTRSLPDALDRTRNRTRRHSFFAAFAMVFVVTALFCGWLYKANARHNLNLRLLNAVRRNDTAGARLLLAQGADPNIRDAPEKQRGLLHQIRYAFHLEPQTDLKSLTLLEMTLGTDFSAIREIENDSLVEALLNAGAKVEDSHRRYRTPLMIAVCHGRLRTVQLLIAHGAKATARETRGKGTLDYLPENHPDGLKIAELLVKNGADVNVVDSTGKTPLIHSAIYGNVPIVRYLVARGAKVDARMIDGDSALLMASNEGTIENIRLLLEHGAEVNVCDKDQNTPLHTAIRIAPPAVAEMLLAHGAKVDAVDKNGDTPLTASLHTSQRSDVVAALIRHGADVNHRNNAKQTPLWLARRGPALKNVKLLEAAGAK